MRSGAKGELLGTYKPPPPNVFAAGWVDAEMFRKWRSASVAFLEDLVGEGHTDVGKAPIQEGRGVLAAVLDDIEASYLTSVRRLIRGEVFTDFLDMAEYLHDNGYGYDHVAVSWLARSVKTGSVR